MVGASAPGASHGASTVAGPLASSSSAEAVWLYLVASGPAFDSVGTYDTIDPLDIYEEFGSSTPCHDLLSPPVNVDNPSISVCVVACDWTLGA